MMGQNADQIPQTFCPEHCTNYCLLLQIKISKLTILFVSKMNSNIT
jgi:hypothetical protein